MYNTITIYHGFFAPYKVSKNELYTVERCEKLEEQIFLLVVERKTIKQPPYENGSICKPINRMG